MGKESNIDAAVLCRFVQGAGLVALPPPAAAVAGLAGKEVEMFRFVPVRVTWAENDNALLRVELGAASSNAFVFRSVDQRYGAAMAACLKNLLVELGQ